MMLIDAVYDFLCPWCLVGKRHLDLAVQQERPAALAIRWHQFMLYPHFDRGGHDFLAFFRERYGDELRVPMWDNIRAVARPVGIEFAFEEMTRGPASIDGHRLVRWAEQQRPGSASALIEDISTSFFERAQIIDIDFLVDTARRHGFNAVAARQHLEGPDDLQEPFAETEAWRHKGVTSMPHYILTFQDGHSEVVKQTSVEIFSDALRRDGATDRRAVR
ncbi:MAG: DsbA family protein [Sphingomonadaceae bacterium]|nr:DsbA family protein [Sphingomonadaceae bacterium]